MRRRLSLLCLAALAATGTATLTPAAAAPPAPAGPAASDAAAVPGELLVGYVSGADEQARGRARGRAEARLAERVVAGGAGRAEVERVHLPQGKSRERAIAELRSDPAVAYAEPNWIYTRQGKPSKPGSGGSTVTPSTGSATGDVASDPYFTNGRLWGAYGSYSVPSNHFGSNAAAAWAAGAVGSTNVYVGVIDEGIQHEHLDLSGQVRNPGELPDGRDNDGNGLVDDTHGWDFVNDDNTVYDGGSAGTSDNHGTHVAGTIGAKADAVGVVGVSQRVGVISAKFLGPDGGTTADAVRAIDYFTALDAKGVHVVATNNSWGGGGFSQALLDAIVRGAKQDILFIAAAGNSGSNNDRRASYPANYDTTSAAGYDAVIAVAAIDSSGGLAGFSQYGSRTVDLGAPGVGIWSTTANNGGYSSYNGTSMATPHVTGAAALYAAKHTPAGGPPPPALQIRTALLGSAVPTASLSGKTVTGGRLDANGALAK